MANASKRNIGASLIRVEGIVQRVGFRRFVERAARSSKIKGYVENVRDGSVKIVAQGEAENIQAFVDEIKAAPRPIIVDSLQLEKFASRRSFKNFRIKTGPLADEMQEGFGAMETQFGDYRSEFTNFRGDFKDFRGDFADYRAEFKDYRNEFRSFSERTDSNFKSLDTKYGEISTKLTEILHSLQTENVEAIKSLNRSVDTLVKAVERISPQQPSQTSS